MKYFVTGATGFIGAEVARQLIQEGHEVIALVRTPAKAKSLGDLGVKLAEGDITDKASLRDPMQGVDGVFHVAGWYKVGVKDPSAAHAINIDGTRNVLEVMRDLNIAKGVYTSTLAVNSNTGGKVVDESYQRGGPWLTLYDETKWRAHYEVAEPMAKAGLPLVTVLPGLVYGPGDTSSVRTLLIQYLQRKLPATPQKTAYAWGYIEDIARGHLLAMQKGVPGENYIIAGPIHTLIEALEIAQEITGIPAPRRHPAPWMMKTMAAPMGVLEKVITLPESYTSEGLRVVAGVTYIGSNEKAKRELGYNPRPLREGLRQTLEHEMTLLGMR